MPDKWGLGMKDILRLFGNLKRFGGVGMLGASMGKKRKWKTRKL